MTSTRVQNQGITDSSVTTSKLADSSVTTSKLANGAITASKLNGNQSGNPPIYGVRAWVNFNGTLNNPNIRASGNVSSVTRVDNTVGQFFITFETPMPDTRYAVSITTSSGDAAENDNQFTSRLIWDTMTTQGFKIKCSIADAGDDSAHDPTVVSIIVIR